MPVLADPGMGKSTLLRREVVTSVQQAYKELAEGKPVNDIAIPLFIRLSSLADGVEKMPAGEAILKIIQERHSTLLKDHENAEVVTFLNAFLKKQLLNGKALLLLDALDEVPDGKRQKLLEKLNEFVKGNQTNPCPMVGTSRIVGYGGRFVDGAKDVEIVPFTQKQTEQYIETWFTNAQTSLKDQSISARGLIKSLRERPQLAGLAQNPLLLSLICSLYQRDQLTLPARRSQIYEQAVNCMLGEWNQTRPDYDDDRTTAKIRLLEELAYHFTSEGQEVFDYEDFYDWIESYLEDGDAPRDLRDAKTGELIAELSEEDGILQKLYRDKNDDQYLFLHRTFQEYFTAAYLKRSLKKNKKNPAYVTELVRKYCWNYDWHETLTLLAGLMDNPIVLIEAIVAEKDDIFQTQLLLAVRCVAECSQISDPLIDKLLDRVYQFWQKYPNAEFIRSAVVALGQTYPQLVQVLHVELKNKTSDVRHRVVKVLGEIGNNRAMDALITALSDENLDVRRTATEALARSGNDKAINTLITALFDKTSDIRHYAARALGEIGSDKAVDALITGLPDENSDVRYFAAEALAKISSDKAVDALITGLSDENSYVRRSVVWALGEIGDGKAINVLITALSDRNSDVRRHAAEALGKVGNDKAVNALITALSDESSYVKRNAAEALGKIGNNKATDALIMALSHEDFYVRSRVAKALGEIGNDEAVGALFTALSDENSDVRSSAAEALAKIGNDETVGALFTALSDENLDVRNCAAKALAKISNDKAVGALIMALSDESSDVGSRAAWALGEIGNDKAVDALITALSDENSDIRSRAAWALGEIGNDKAADALITALSDENSDVRKRAAGSLRRISNDEAVGALITALSDESSNVKNSAAWALGEIGNDKAADALITALSDENSDVRSSAAWALGRIGNDEAVGALFTALSDENSYVRHNAAEALLKIGSVAALEELLRFPKLTLDATIFSLARSWAISFSKAGSSSIPVYSELLPKNY